MTRAGYRPETDPFAGFRCECLHLSTYHEDLTGRCTAGDHVEMPCGCEQFRPVRL